MQPHANAKQCNCKIFICYSNTALCKSETICTQCNVVYPPIYIMFGEEPFNTMLS